MTWESLKPITLAPEVKDTDVSPTMARVIALRRETASMPATTANLTPSEIAGINARRAISSHDMQQAERAVREALTSMPPYELSLGEAA